MSSYKHALVLGASGVSGWAVVNQLLEGYPDGTTHWDRVTAVTNRPLSVAVSQWPDKASLQIVSGIDLLAGTLEDLKGVLDDKVADVDKVTHVYYYGMPPCPPSLFFRISSVFPPSSDKPAYKTNPDFDREKKDAVDMLARAISAVDQLSDRLQFVAFQTGAKVGTPSPWQTASADH